MADITKCVNEKCPLKGICYRSIAPSSGAMQSFDCFEFSIDEDNKISCDRYYETSELPTHSGADGWASGFADSGVLLPLTLSPPV
jgi:hypothetical protein